MDSSGEDTLRRQERKPENYEYRDDGCELAPSCLRCPLPQCKYDNPGWHQRKLQDQSRERRTAVVAAIRSDHLSASEAAVRFSLSPRTVFRFLQEQKESVTSQ